MFCSLEAPSFVLVGLFSVKHSLWYRHVFILSFIKCSFKLFSSLWLDCWVLPYYFFQDFVSLKGEVFFPNLTFEMEKVFPFNFVELSSEKCFNWIEEFSILVTTFISDTQYLWNIIWIFFLSLSKPAIGHKTKSIYVVI